MPIATYTFLPWLRRGIANQLKTAAGAGASHASLSVTLAAKSDKGRRDLEPVTIKLVGPGDVSGIDARQIIRTEPRTGVGDFEPNYLAAIDFYDEDFPWRYTPLAPDQTNHRLAPWLVLAVLKDAEFTRGGASDQPLPSFTLTSAARRRDIFPVAGQEWAFAHVHVNAALSGTTAAPDLTQLETLLAANPDAAYARLIAPRRLEPNTSYTAFLVPAFEVGRKAGLGEPVADTDDGTVRSWDGSAQEFPIYFEWSFRTGVGGDFESLVRAIVPRDLDSRVGVRDMSIRHPGFGIDDAHNPPDDLVGLEGALIAPATVRRGPVPANDFVPQAEAVLNAPAQARTAATEDPLVAPPIYGCWHAQVERVHAAGMATNWIDLLNLDPRYRAAAGVGARVIRNNQEKYVRIAWDQIGEVITVNHKIRCAQLAGAAAAAQFTKSFSSLPPERVLSMAAPAFKKVMGSQNTLAAQVKASQLPVAALSPSLRSVLRPRGRLAQCLLALDDRVGGLTQVVAETNAGRLSAAPPRPKPGGVTIETINDTLTLDTAADRGRPSPALVEPMRHATTMLARTGLAPGAIALAPAPSDYSFASASTDATLPTAGRPAPPLVEGDNPAAADMRRALITIGEALARQVEPPAPKPPLDIARVHQRLLEALEPRRAIATRFAPLFHVGALDARSFAATHYPVRSPPRNPDTLQEIMNYPDIKEAMYAPLIALSSEYFLPNLKFIPNNTISLLTVNQSFIEAYLVGLNHEFARLLLWREYPTDQRGSYFRQFWDVSSYVDTQGRDAKTLAEDLKDIPPIHQWPAPSVLGSHEKRQPGADQLVLVIRGDLLKRYPNTFIYAQKAVWGTGVRANLLVLADETGELVTTSPNDPRLRFPLYRARIDPDIHFIGFDLSLEDARGDPRLEETAAARAIVGDKLGWMFVIQEAVGEPRFGLETDAPGEPSADIWDNLAWINLDLRDGQAVDVAKPFVSAPTGANPRGVGWGTNSADLAFILYREPVMVAVHARNMLKNLNRVS